MMNIAVIGGGRVGLPVAVGLAKLGRRVVCCERDSARRRAAAAGRAWFADAGLAEALADVVQSGILRFCADSADAVAVADAVFVAVPVGDSEADELFSIAAAVAQSAPADCILIVKSTVPPGTCGRLADVLPRKICVVANPEFLRQGHGLHDFLSPARIVVGAASPRAFEMMRRIYAPLMDKGARYMEMSCVSAEIAKLAANLFLSSRVTLINETADLCESAGGDIVDVAEAVGADKRIGGDYLRPGAGFGGACLPKDGRLLKAAARELGTEMSATEAIFESNRHRPQRIAARLAGLCSAESVVAVWGLAYKPDSDDVCDSPAIEVVRCLRAAGVRINGYEPALAADVRRRILPEINFFDDRWAMLADADILAILVGHEAFFQASAGQIRRAMKGATVFDCAGIFHRDAMKGSGLILHTVGQPSL